MSPALKIRIPSIVGDVKGNLELYFYAPMGWKEGLGKSKEKYPLLVNFHGGGYTIGHVSVLPPKGIDERLTSPQRQQTMGVSVPLSYHVPNVLWCRSTTASRLAILSPLRLAIACPR